MRFHLAASAATHACTRIAVATAIISITTACSDGRNATSGDDAELFNLSLRNNRNAIALTARDSSIAVGDTVRVLLPVQTAYGPNGSRRAGLRFVSSDTGVATIDNDGLIRARQNGRATMLVRTLTGAGTLAITVWTPPARDSISTLSPADTVATPSEMAPPSAATPAVPAPPQTAPETPTPPVSAPPVSAPPAVVIPSEPGTLPSFTAPQLPQAQVDVSMPATASRTLRVPAGDTIALQAALNAAVGGDEVVLPDGAIFRGTFHLPRRSGGGVVTLRSETVPVSPHTRITPSRAGSLATLFVNSVYPALVADDGAQGWRVVAVRMQLGDNAVDNYGIVTLGSGVQTSASQFPRNIILDRVVVQGSYVGNTSRCVSMNGIALAVIDSWLAECHSRGRDAQAVGAWTGTGPLLIENNHLEGSGQAILFGGSDPQVYGVVPGDITIRRNHLFKPLSWAGRWTVKAAFEIKNAERVLFEANVIENHWTDAQVGFAILLQAVNQDGKAAWSSVRDITMRLNAIRNSRSGVNLLSRLSSGSAPVSDVSRRILLRDNSFENVGRDPVNGAAGRYVQLLDDLEDVTIVQNTFFGSGAANAVMFDGKPTLRLALANNVFAHTTYGILGSGLGEGLATLARFAPGAAVTGNVLPGLLGQLYGTGSVFPASLSLSDFVDAANGNYSLQPGLPFSTLNGARTGVNGAAVVSAIAAVTAQ